MRNLLLVLVAIIVVLITMISVYLTPDDLRGCKAPAATPKCKPADAIVAISGGNTSVRAAEAIRLYGEGWSDTLIFSGAAADPTGPSNAEVMRRQAIDAGVPAEDIKVEVLSQTTRQNAEQVKELLSEVGGSAKSIILVTSPYHQRRASLEFHELVGDGITITNRPTPNDPDWSKLWWLTPRGWWLAGGELVKIVAFYVGESR